MSEKINIPKFEKLEADDPKIDQISSEPALEKSTELPQKKSPENLADSKEVETARNEALELAKSQEVEPAAQAEKAKPDRQPDKPTKVDLDANFERTMTSIRKDMTPASRTLSKIIHNPTVDKISNVVGSTVARPNLILAGALGTLVICTVIYMVAKFYGYRLSGSEAIVTFILGWMVGAIVEFARVGMSSKQN